MDLNDYDLATAPAEPTGPVTPAAAIAIFTPTELGRLRFVRWLNDRRPLEASH